MTSDSTLIGNTRRKQWMSLTIIYKIWLDSPKSLSSWNDKTELTGQIQVILCGLLIFFLVFLFYFIVDAVTEDTGMTSNILYI